MSILAWDVPGKRVVSISAQEIIAATSLKFRIPEGDKK
jgi:hypothetical protein